MIVKNNKPITPGDIDEFFVHKAGRVILEDRQTKKPIETSIFRVEFRRVSDNKQLNHDVYFNAWIDPRKLYKGLSGNIINSADETAAINSYVKQVEVYNTLIENAINKGVENLTAQEIKDIEKAEKDLPHSMIGRDQFMQQFIDICNAVGVDATGVLFDSRVLNPTVERKVTREGKAVVITSPSFTGDIPNAIIKTKDYMSANDFNVQACSDVALNGDVKMFEDLSNFFTKNIIGKPFRMLVGGEYSRKDNSGPHPALPPYNFKFAEPISEPNTLKYNPALHIDTTHSLGDNTSKVGTDEESNNLPF